MQDKLETVFESWMKKDDNGSCFLDPMALEKNPEVPKVLRKYKVQNVEMAWRGFLYGVQYAREHDE